MWDGWLETYGNTKKMRHLVKQTCITGNICWTAVRIQLEKVLKLRGNNQWIFNKFHVCWVEDTRMLQSIPAWEKRSDEPSSYLAVCF